MAAALKYTVQEEAPEAPTAPRPLTVALTSGESGRTEAARSPSTTAQQQQQQHAWTEPTITIDPPGATTARAPTPPRENAPTPDHAPTHATHATHETKSRILSTRRSGATTADHDDLDALQREGDDIVQPSLQTPLRVNVEAAGTGAAGSQPSTPSGLGPRRPSSLKMPSGAKSSVNKSKLMSMMGEMLPTNALDATGYEQREEDAGKKLDLSDEIVTRAIQDGLMELDALGHPIYKSRSAHLRVLFRKRIHGIWKVRDPASTSRQYWSLLVVALLLYGMVEIPIRIGFDQDVVAWSFPDIFNLLVDIFFLCDVFVNFRTGYYSDDNRLCLDERKIAMQYLKGWFLLDAVTSIPISQLMQAILIGSPQKGLAVLALPRILRVFRIARLFKILRMLKLMSVMSNWSESTNEKLFSLVIKVLKFMTLIFLLAHLSGCIWGYIAMQQKDGDGNFHHLSWPYRYGIYNFYDTTFGHLYLLSLYWALCTLTTVGYGDIHAGSSYEYAFCIVLTFVGTCSFGYIIGTISSILKHGKETETLFLGKMAQLNIYMSYRKISPFLQKKVRSHYEYLWKHQTLYNEAEILDDLPNYLKSDLSIFLYKDLTERVPFLADMGPDVAMLVTLKLKPLQFMPGSYVYTRSLLGRDMYFVSKGTVEVINSGGFIICQLKEGATFGEMAILSEKPVYRTASIRARTFIDLLSLSKNDFETIWSLYPEIYAKIILRAKTQWQQVISENQTEMIGSIQLGETTSVALHQRTESIATPVKPAPKAASTTSTGDTVIRIEKSDDVGSERRLMRTRIHASSTGGELASDDDLAVSPDVEEEDDDTYEPSYLDSLAEMHSENDEEFDPLRDIVDLPDHLLPPPRPLIRGSFVVGDQRAQETAANQELLATTASRRLKSFFSGSEGRASIAPKETPERTRTLVRRTSAESPRGKVTPADTSSATGTPKDQRRSLASGSISPMMKEALLSPAEERQLQRRKDIAFDRRQSMDVQMALLHEAQLGPAANETSGVLSTPPQRHTFLAIPGASSHRSVASHSSDGLNRVGSVFSSMLSPTAAPARDSAVREVEQPESTADTGLTATNVSRVALLKKQHTKRISNVPHIVLEGPDADTDGPSAVNSPSDSFILPPSAVAAAPPNLLAASSDNPAFWTSLQALLSQSLQPLQSQYKVLASEHAQLLAKQAHTEHLLRTVVTALKTERATHAAASRAHLQVEGSDVAAQATTTSG